MKYLLALGAIGVLAFSYFKTGGFKTFASADSITNVPENVQVLVASSCYEPLAHGVPNASVTAKWQFYGGPWRTYTGITNQYGFVTMKIGAWAPLVYLTATIQTAAGIVVWNSTTNTLLGSNTPTSIICPR